jgi:hypothetical protein
MAHGMFRADSFMLLVVDSFSSCFAWLHARLWASPIMIQSVIVNACYNCSRRIHISYEFILQRFILQDKSTSVLIWIHPAEFSRGLTTIETVRRYSS